MYRDCCHACRESRLRGASFLERISVTMLLCPTCGNKRCPRANHHDNACTGSNEPGQPGSAYPLPKAITKTYDLIDESLPETIEADADPARPEANPFAGPPFPGLYVQPWRVTWGDHWRFKCTWREAMDVALSVSDRSVRARVERISNRPAIRAGLPVDNAPE